VVTTKLLNLINRGVINVQYISSRKLTDKESELLELEKDDPAIVIEDKKMTRICEN